MVKSKIYFFNDIIDIQNFDQKILNRKKVIKNILICYIGYVVIKDSKYVKVNSVNLLYFIFSKSSG